MSLNLIDQRTWTFTYRIDVKYEIMNPPDICNICDKDFEKLGRLGCCNKLMCYDCVHEWFGDKSFNCPYCRRDIRCVARLMNDSLEYESTPRECQQ
jgi:hypothetical protein